MNHRLMTVHDSLSNQKRAWFKAMLDFFLFWKELLNCASISSNSVIRISVRQTRSVFVFFSLLFFLYFLNSNCILNQVYFWTHFGVFDRTIQCAFECVFGVCNVSSIGSNGKSCCDLNTLEIRLELFESNVFGESPNKIHHRLPPKWKFHCEIQLLNSFSVQLPLRMLFFWLVVRYKTQFWLPWSISIHLHSKLETKKDSFEKLD